MAHYDVFAFSTAASSIEMSDHKYTSWAGSAATNWALTSDEPIYANYFIPNLFSSLAFKLKNGVRWAITSGYADAIGFRADTGNAYAGTKRDIGTAIQNYLTDVTGNNNCSIHSWQVTTNSLQVALDGYLFGAYHDLYSNNTYTQHFDETTGVIEVTFSNGEKLTLRTKMTSLTKGKFTYLIDNPKFKYNNYDIYKDEPKYIEEFYYYDKATLYSLTTYPTKEDEDGNIVEDTDALPLGMFRYVYNKGTTVTTPKGVVTVQADTPASNTVLNINYGESVDDSNIIWRNVSYVIDGSDLALEKIIQIWAISQLTFHMVPIPWSPVKESSLYIDKNSNKYKQCVNYLKHIFSADIYSMIYKNIEETPNQQELANAYMMWGVNLNNRTQSGKKYLFILFKQIYQHYLVQRGLSAENIKDEWYTKQATLVTNYGPRQQTVISNHLMDLSGYISWYSYSGTVARGICWTGIVSRSVKGVAQAGAKTGQYFVEPCAVTSEPYVKKDIITTVTKPSGSGGDPNATVENTKTTTHTYYLTSPGVAFRYQDTNETYQEICVYNLTLYNPVGHYGIGNLFATIDATLANTAASFDYCMSKGEPIYKDNRTTIDSYGRPPEITGYIYKYDPKFMIGMAAGNQFVYDNAGSVYLGYQNVYQNVVIDFQTVNNQSVTFKPSIADDDSGFIIPFDLTMMENFPMSELNDLVTKGTYLIAESYHFEQPHYKGYKKWLAIVVTIIAIIIVIIVSIVTWGSGTAPASKIGAAICTAVGAAVGTTTYIVLMALCKILVAFVVAFLAKVLAKAIFGNSFIGTMFQIVITLVVCYYDAGGTLSGLSDYASSFEGVASIASTTLKGTADYFNTKNKSLTDEYNKFNSLDQQNQEQYNQKNKLLSSRMAELYNQTSNFNVSNYVNAITTRQTSPIYDGVLSGPTWNNALISYTDYSIDALTTELIDVDRYLEVDQAII